MRLPLSTLVLPAAKAEPEPPKRPRRILRCRGCSEPGEVAPMVEVWVCPACRRIEEGPPAEWQGVGGGQ